MFFNMPIFFLFLNQLMRPNIYETQYPGTNRVKTCPKEPKLETKPKQDKPKLETKPNTIVQTTEPKSKPKLVGDIRKFMTAQRRCGTNTSVDKQIRSRTIRDKVAVFKYVPYLQRPDVVGPRQASQVQVCSERHI